MRNQRVTLQGGRPCWVWWHDWCVIAATPGTTSRVCRLFERCMFAAKREDLTPEQLEVWEAWCDDRVCLLVYLPDER